MGKRLYVCIVALISLLLSSCEFISSIDWINNIINPVYFTLTDGMVEKNLVHIEEPELINDVELLDLSVYSTVSTNFNYGLVFVIDSENRKGVFSLISNKLIFPLEENLEINLIPDIRFKAFVLVSNTVTSTQRCYNLVGNVLLEENTYSFVDIRGTGGNEITVEYMLLNNPKLEVKKYELNQETLQLTQKEDEFNLTPYRIDLEKYGLDKHYAMNIGNNLYVYEEDTDKNISNFKIPNSSINAVFDGHYFYQSTYPTSIFAEEYTYTTGSTNMVVKTYSINMLNGQSKEHNVEYLIENIRPLYDESGIYKYAEIKYKKISSRILLNDISYYAIIDKDGKILQELPLRLSQLRRINDDYYYDDENKYIVSKKLVPIMNASFGNIIPSENYVIVEQNGLYGSVDFAGNVKIPFEYTSLKRDFINGWTLGKTSDGRTYLVKAEQEPIEITSQYEDLYDGLLLTYTYDDVEGTYSGSIIDFSSDEKLRLDFTDRPDTYSFDSKYGRYAFLDFTSDRKIVSILKDKPSY